ncbi:MAG: L,D-transpeptidase family protein [Alphaproteobacteria bacterium]|nr:L,D-transpeptidase family protein [Alphaproteobacteria bacterium]
MKHLALSIALAGSLALAIPATPVFAADESAEAIQKASFATDEAERDMREAFGKSGLRNGQFLWKAGANEVDRIVINLSDQIAYAYDDGELVAVSTISSGDEKHLSPIGVFSILEKQRMHHSKKYDDAPMPFMQRITDSGVALHAGQLPGHPASHGCLRLPAAFAAKLFGATKVGTTVMIAEPDGPMGSHKAASASWAYNDRD